MSYSVPVDHRNYGRSKMLHDLKGRLNFRLLYPMAFLMALLPNLANADYIEIPSKVDSVLSNYCFSCHDADTEKGGVRLDNLSELSLDGRLESLNRMHEQLYIREMPPEKKKAQPSASERELVMDWVFAELEKHGGSKLEDKLRYPDFGNYVDHDMLFSGDIKEAGYTLERTSEGHLSAGGQGSTASALWNYQSVHVARTFRGSRLRYQLSGWRPFADDAD